MNTAQSSHDAFGEERIENVLANATTNNNNVVEQTNEDQPKSDSAGFNKSVSFGDDSDVFPRERRSSEPVINIQPHTNVEVIRAQLPVATTNWQSNPRGQFIPVHGLDFLIGVTKLQIQQTIEISDLTARIESENRYIVKVPNGESLYIASEVSNSTQRCFCGSGRGFTMYLHDNTRQEALVLKRRLAGATCCFPCRLQEMQVFVPSGELIGRIQQQWTWMVPFFLVKDGNDDVVFVIEGPASTYTKSSQLCEFKVMSGDSLREIGKITHCWERDLVSYATTVRMPEDISQPRIKALLLAAAFLFEYTYFERAKTSWLRCNCF